MMEILSEFRPAFLQNWPKVIVMAHNEQDVLDYTRVSRRQPSKNM